MILERIHAINILKYAELKLDNIPSAGLIAVSGLNESGKSTIGETVCFALFGRTFSLDYHETDKILRWGELQCSATVGFEVKGEHYELSRFLDSEGHHSAKLLRVGEAEPFARGVPKVADAVLHLLGFKFEEFIESFYLAQREITTPHPHSHAVKIMAGVAPMEIAINECNQEVKDYKDKIVELGAELETIDQELIDLKLEEGLLIKVEDERTALQHRVINNRRVLERLETGFAGYTDQMERLQVEQKARNRMASLRWLLLALTLLTAGLWGLLSLGAHLPVSEHIHNSLQGLYAGWQVKHAHIIGVVAVVFAVLLIIVWSRVSMRRMSVLHLSADASRFAHPLEEARRVEEYVIAPNSALGDLGSEPAPRTDNEVQRPYKAQFDEVHARVINGFANLPQVADYTEAERDWLQNLLLRQSLRATDLDQVVEEETVRLQQAARLHEVIDDLSGKREAMQQEIETRHKSVELLEGATRHQSGHFNRDIRELVGRTLPLFTDGRYEHLKIGDALTVQVFSAEKRDFMELDEVSSGTQRQIMLALRLALSQKLLDRAVKEKQFAFLDEPFAFFDEERTHKSLNALREMNNDITQIWIVAQSFPEHEMSGFATHIDCGREIGVLTHEG